jgi:hypothetical protein
MSSQATGKGRNVTRWVVILTAIGSMMAAIDTLPWRRL